MASTWRQNWWPSKLRCTWTTNMYQCSFPADLNLHFNKYIGILKNPASLNAEVSQAASLLKRHILRQWQEIFSLDLAHCEPWEDEWLGENQMRDGITGPLWKWGKHCCCPSSDGIPSAVFAEIFRPHHIQEDD